MSTNEASLLSGLKAFISNFLHKHEDLKKAFATATEYLTILLNQPVKFASFMTAMISKPAHENIVIVVIMAAIMLYTLFLLSKKYPAIQTVYQSMLKSFKHSPVLKEAVKEPDRQGDDRKIRHVLIMYFILSSIRQFYLVSQQLEQAKQNKTLSSAKKNSLYMLALIGVIPQAASLLFLSMQS